MINREQETAMYDQPDDGGDEVNETVQVCSICHRGRTLSDVYDYSPLQVVMGQPLGWYSGDDGEICPEDMTRMIARQ